MFKLYKNNRIAKKTVFSSYEAARQAARKIIRKTYKSTDVMTSWNTNPPIGDFGFSVKRLTA